MHPNMVPVYVKTQADVAAIAEEMRAAALKDIITEEPRQKKKHLLTPKQFPKTFKIVAASELLFTMAASYQYV